MASRVAEAFIASRLNRVDDDGIRRVYFSLLILKKTNQNNMIINPFLFHSPFFFCFEIDDQEFMGKEGALTNLLELFANIARMKYDATNNFMKKVFDDLGVQYQVRNFLHSFFLSYKRTLLVHS